VIEGELSPPPSPSPIEGEGRFLVSSPVKRGGIFVIRSRSETTPPPSEAPLLDEEGREFERRKRKT